VHKDTTIQCFQDHVSPAMKTVKNAHTLRLQLSVSAANMDLTYNPISNANVSHPTNTPPFNVTHPVETEF